MGRTIPALRQAVFAALTTPALTYTVNNGSPQTLPAASVVPRAPWATGAATPPDPLVSFSVAGRGQPSLQLAYRFLTVKVWVSSAGEGGDDLVTELYEAVRARLQSPNAEGISPLARSATASTLPIAIAQLRETEALEAAFETQSQRWYATGSFAAVAQ